MAKNDGSENNQELRKPSYPTDALPGSAAKVEVMVARVACGEHPHHPDDARDTDDGPGFPMGERADIVREREIQAGRMDRSGLRRREWLGKQSRRGAVVV